MKNLLISDLHLTVRDSEFIEVDGFKYPKKLYSKVNIIKDIIDKFQKEHKDDGRIIICGDIFHEKRYVYDLALKAFIDILMSIEIETYIISGNHDTTSRGNHNYSLLSWIDSLPLTDKIILIEPGKYKVIDNMALVSWDRDIKKVIGEMMESIDPNKVRILISHFGIDEASVSSGIYIKSDIKFKQIKDYFDLIILGHYHKPQKLTDPKCDLYYVGSVIQENWGEGGEEKRYMIMDNETLDIQSIPITGYSKYVTIETDDIKEYQKLIKESNKDDYIRVKTKNKELQDICLSDDIKCMYIPDVAEYDGDKIENIDIQEDIFKGYLCKMDIKEEDQPKYIKILNKIIES